MKLIRRTNLFLILAMILSLALQPLHPVLATYGDIDKDSYNQVIDEGKFHEVNLNDILATSNDEDLNEKINESEINVSSASEETDNETDEQTNENILAENRTTTEAPKGYEPKYDVAEKENKPRVDTFAQVTEEDANKRVLLVQDVRPWDTNTNEVVLSGLREYDKVTTSQFLTVNLANYGVIVFANDQPFDSYENYTSFKGHIETFARLGGVIVFGAADGGWANGNLIEDLPGGVKKTSHYEYRNFIDDDNHPIITGTLTDNIRLTDSELVETYASHVSFEEDSLPAGSKVILRETTTDRPTLVEYPLEKGRVIASGLTWEFNYVYGGTSHSDIGIRGKYAKTSMKDMFEYAIRVSDISVDDLKILEQMYIESNAHHILVASKETEEPIANAQVVIDGEKFKTDEDGLVKYTGPYKKELVKVSKDGYRTSEQEYNISKRTVNIFFLEDDPMDNKPYITRIQEKNYQSDLRTQSIRVMEGDKNVKEIIVAGDWKGHAEGIFRLYQEGEMNGPAGKRIVSATGEFGFSPGTLFNPKQPVKLIMVSPDGVESDPVTINLSIDRKIPPKDANGENTIAGIEDLNEFHIADDQKGEVTDSDFRTVFPLDFEIEAPFVPVKIQRELKDNGTIEYKGTIGLVNDNLLKNEREWLTFKGDIKSTERNLEKVFSRLNDFGWNSFKVQRQLLNPQIRTAGYIEITTDRNGQILESGGGIIVQGTNTSNYTQQFLYGPFPFYVDLTGKIDVKFKAGLSFSKDTNDLEYYTGEIKITPEIALGGGVGVVGLASAGVEGGAGLEIQFLPSNKGTIEAYAKLKAQVLFFGEWNFTLAQREFELWPTERNMMASNHADIDSNLSLVSRDYTEKATTWNGSNQLDAQLFNQVSSEELLTLQEWIMPYTMPQFATVHDTLIALFHMDDKDRNTGDHTILMYSVYENHSWSEPTSVWESDTADFYFKSFEFNNELYVVWQKSSQQGTTEDVEDLLNEMAQNSEISFAKWNNNTKEFESQQFITDNNVLDMYATLASDGDNLTAVWVSNNENDLFGQSGTYSVMQSTLSNGIWSDPIVIHETEDYITELSAGYVDGLLQIAYTENSENKGSEVYLINDSKQVNKISTEEFAKDLTFYNDLFYWYSNGKIVEYNAIQGSKEIISVGEEAVIGASYKLIGDEGSKRIVWIETVEDSSIIYASLETEDGWSKPIQLYQNNDFSIYSMDVKQKDNGNWEFILNTLSYEDDEPKHSLVFVTEGNKVDTELNYVYVDETLREGNSQLIEFSVTNLSESPVNSLKLKIEKDNEHFYSKDIKTQIAPGGTVVLEETIDVSTIKSETDLDVYVYNNEETNKSNNMDALALGLTDVSMTLQHYKLDNKYIVAAKVENHSYIPANVAIKVIEDSSDGIVLDVKNIGKLEDGLDYLYIYSIDLDKIDFGENDSKRYYFKIETLEKDINEQNHSDLLVIYKDEEIEISDEPIEDIAITRVTGVEVSSENVLLGLDDPETSTVQLHADVTPSNATMPYVKWSSNDASVVTVDSTGLVTAVGSGDAIVTVTTYDGDFVSTVNVTVTPEKEQPVFEPFELRVNVNGDEYIDQAGQTWLEDQEYSEGDWGYTRFFGLNKTTSEIEGTEDHELYQSYRMFSQGEGYKFDLPNGNYEVTLKFMDDWSWQKEHRQFDILLNDETVKNGFDIFDTCGTFTACDQTFNVQIEDGLLEIGFDWDNGAGWSVISAIEIIEQAPLDTPK